MIDFGFYNEWISLLRSEAQVKHAKKFPGPVYIEMKDMHQEHSVNELFKKHQKNQNYKNENLDI